MIDAKRAVEIAKEKATEMLGERLSYLEEIERGSYRDREIWSITLSFPRDLTALPAIIKLTADALQYKRFLIDVQTGDLLAMKLREVASR
jgi:hypothetical protein